MSNRSAKRFIALLGLGLWMSGCATAPQPRPAPPRKVALVLGGGGARGFAHVGVLRELEAEKIPIDLIVGISVGSLIGALYADQPDSLQLEWKAFQIEQKQIFDFNLLTLANGLAKGDAIKAYLDANLSVRRIELLKIPLAVVSTDLRSGRPFLFTQGPIRDAVRASTSVPGIFAPVPFQDKLLVDGAVLGNCQSQAARDLGATLVIGVNLTVPRARANPANVLEVLLESVEIMGSELVRLNRADFDVLIEPETNAGILDFTRKKELIEAGRAAARLAMPRIKEKLGLLPPSAAEKP